jgi:hypothetical protein
MHSGHLIGEQPDWTTRRRTVQRFDSIALFMTSLSIYNFHLSLLRLFWFSAQVKGFFGLEFNQRNGNQSLWGELHALRRILSCCAFSTPIIMPDLEFTHTINDSRRFRRRSRRRFGCLAENELAAFEKAITIKFPTISSKKQILTDSRENISSCLISKDVTVNFDNLSWNKSFRTIQIMVLKLWDFQDRMRHFLSNLCTHGQFHFLQHLRNLHCSQRVAWDIYLREKISGEQWPGWLLPTKFT